MGVDGGGNGVEKKKNYYFFLHSMLTLTLLGNGAKQRRIKERRKGKEASKRGQMRRSED